MVFNCPNTGDNEGYAILCNLYLKTCTQLLISVTSVSEIVVD